MIMKRIIVRVISLFATFIFAAAISATLTILAAPQESVYQKCRSRCSSEFQICINRLGDNPRPKDRERCNYYNRQCVSKCKPKASIGE
jgi:hypothetical protein